MHRREARRLRATAIAMGLLAAMLLQLGPLGVDAAGAEYAHLNPPFADATTARASRDLGALSDFFTENAGQVGNPEVLYYARGGGVSVGFADGAVVVNLRERPARDDPRTGAMVHAPAGPEAPAVPIRGHLIRIAFEGANPVFPQARGELPHRANFFLGDDPARWRTGVRNYAEVVYEDAWDGIDVVYRPSPGGVKYDLVVHPGADLADVAFRYEGVADVAVTPRGLSAETSLGPLRDDVPAAWQASGLPVDCALRRIAERTVGYACSGWDRTGDLVIDPLLYATFLGGSGDDAGNGIAVDASGAAYVTGHTEDAATGFPTTLGAYDTTHNGRWDAFVAKLDASGGTLLYSTFLGGSGYDPAYGIAIDASGAAYVTGQTFDDVTDFPTTPGAYDTTDNGGGDVFVAKLTLVPGTMPVLSPTGEPNYGTDGLDPEAGTMASLYVYRVEYSDADDDLPAGGDPKVHIRKGGIDVAGSPFAMTDVDPFDADVTNGKWYAYATPLASRGTDYDYDFTATDATGLAAMNWPAPPADAPDVLNAAPTADAGLDLSAFKNVLVVLDGRLSFDPDGDTLTHAWTAPPGITLSDANVPMPTFTATRSGTFPFILTVDDGDPANGTDTDTVVITVWGLPPVADLTADRTRANVGGAFLFSGAGSTDADGTIAAYLFEFADGTDQLGGSDTATHAYAAPGSYVVRLTVWDDDGNASATDTLTVTVNAPPVASGTVTPASGTLATAFTFTSTSTDSDGTIVTTTWDFGDGATESGTAVTHAYATRQTFTVTLTVWDDDGATATTTLSVTVGNLPPTAVLAVTPDGGEVGTVFTFDGSASTDDGTIIVYAWDFGDGTTGSGVVVTHRYTRNGTFVATLTVTDDGGLDGTAIVSIAVTPALGDTTPGDGANDGTIVGIIVVIITATILVLWRLRFVWFPYFIMWCYTRLRRDEILDNFARGEINGYVRLNPGDSYVEIKRNLGVAAGPLTYHLAVLEREGLVRSVLRGSRKLFYPLDVRIPENGGGLNAIQERTLRMLREEPGMTVSDIADNLGVSRYVALYHVRKLVRADLARLDRRMARLRAYPVLAIAP